MHFDSDDEKTVNAFYFKTSYYKKQRKINKKLYNYKKTRKTNKKII